MCVPGLLQVPSSIRVETEERLLAIALRVSLALSQREVRLPFRSAYPSRSASIRMARVPAALESVSELPSAPCPLCECGTAAW